MNQRAVALWVISSVLCITLCNTQSSLASPPVVEAPERTARVEKPAPTDKRAPTALQSASAPSKPAAGAAEARRTVRRIKGSEMTVPVVKKAREIINEHYKKPIGTEIEFEIGGKRYVGRIEPHYHPPGGELRPWGHHKGCSLYVVEES